MERSAVVTRCSNNVAGCDNESCSSDDDFEVVNSIKETIGSLTIDDENRHVMNRTNFALNDSFASDFVHLIAPTFEIKRSSKSANTDCSLDEGSSINDKAMGTSSSDKLVISDDAVTNNFSDVQSIDLVHSIVQTYQGCEKQLKDEITKLRTECKQKSEKAYEFKLLLQEAEERNGILMQENFEKDMLIKEKSEFVDQMVASTLEFEELVKAQSAVIKSLRIDGEGSQLPCNILNERTMLIALDSKNTEIERLNLLLEEKEENLQHAKSLCRDLEEVIKVLNEQNVESDQALRDAQNEYRFHMNRFEEIIQGHFWIRFHSLDNARIEFLEFPYTLPSSTMSSLLINNVLHELWCRFARMLTALGLV